MTKKLDRATLRALYGTDNPVTIIKQKQTGMQRRAFAGGNEGDVVLTEQECRDLCKGANNFTYTPGDEKRVISYVVTNETADRYGDIVRAKGVDLTNYLKNPVVQFAHDYTQPPVAHAIRAWYDPAGNCIRAWALFFSKEIDPSGRADLIHRIAAANGMRACSIGFMPTETNRPQKAEDREALGLGEWGVEFVACDMMEFSPCPVPANPECLQDDMRKAYQVAFVKNVHDGLFTRKDVELLAGYPLFKQIGTLDELIKQLGDTVPVVKTLDKVIAELGAASVEDKSEELYGKEITADLVTKPYPNEHACRLVTPNGGKTRRKNGAQEHEGKKYDVIYQEKDDGKWEQQAYRYPKETWTAAEAKAHCKSHKGILFEPAKSADGLIDPKDLCSECGAGACNMQHKDIDPEGSEPANDPDEATETALLQFLVDNPNPDDTAVHAWAAKQKLDPSAVETMAYEFASLWARIAGPGSPAAKADLSKIEPDALAQGIVHEYEHTVGTGPEDRVVAQYIAIPHIAENFDYYEEIDEMENEPDEAEGAAMKVSGNQGEEPLTLPADQMDHLFAVCAKHVKRALAPDFERVHGRIDSTHGSLKRMHEKADACHAEHMDHAEACHAESMGKHDATHKTINDLNLKADAIHGHTSDIPRIKNQLDNLESTLQEAEAARQDGKTVPRKQGGLYAVREALGLSNK